MTAFLILSAKDLEGRIRLLQEAAKERRIPGLGPGFAFAVWVASCHQLRLLFFFLPGTALQDARVTW